MSARGRWAFSPLDRQAHLLVADDRPCDELRTQCGEVLPPTAFRTTVQPTVAPTCSVCGEIAAALISGRWQF